MKQWRVFGVALAVVWLFVRGVATTPMAVLGEFLIGLAIGYPIAFTFRRFYTASLDVSRLVTVLPQIGRYLLLFGYEVVTASLDVAYRALAPSMPLSPAVLMVPLRVHTDAAITTIANSITLTPGTLTMDYDEDEHALYVHAIDASDPEAVLAPIRRWEDYALVIFDEDAPEGPIREPTVNPGKQSRVATETHATGEISTKSPEDTGDDHGD